MKNGILLFVIIIFSFAACKKDKKENNGPTAPKTIQLDSFPLTIGNSWKFYTEIHLSIPSDTFYQNDYYDNYWKVVKDTLINGTKTAKISQLDSNYNGTTRLAFTYYTNKQDGFYGVACENNGSMFFLKTSALYYNLHSFLLNAFGEKVTQTDSIFIPNNSLYLIRFPVIINDYWNSNEYGQGANVIRKWIKDTTITTTAGTFDCIKLQVIFDSNHDGLPDTNTPIIFQYFGLKGLIEETQFNNFIGSGGSTGTMSRTTKLVKINF